MHARLAPLLIVALIAMAPPALAMKAPDSWDGLVKVDAKKLAAVYLLPDADFRSYSKVIVDRPEVAFKKDWQRQYNRTQRSLGGRVNEKDVRDAIDRASASFVKALSDAYAKAGYELTAQSGPDVLRVSTAIVNLSVDAPDQMTAARSRTYSREAGEATLVLEIRDSVSGSLMGRALDRRLAGDNFSGPYLRNAVTNQSDFEMLFERWAKVSAEGITKLKALSPIDGNGQPRR